MHDCKKDPKLRARMRKLLGTRHYGDGQWRQAAVQLQKCWMDNPDCADGRVWQMCARAHYKVWVDAGRNPLRKRKRLNAALASYKHSMQSIDVMMDPVLWLEVGQLQAMLGSFAEALPPLLRIVESCPKFPRRLEAVFAAAAASLQLGRYEAASNMAGSLVETPPPPYEHRHMWYLMARAGEHKEGKPTGEWYGKIFEELNSQVTV